jgi:hypothetical protein
MRHPVIMKGWPFPWSVTNEEAKKEHIRFVHLIADRLYGGGVVLDDVPVEVWDGNAEVFEWTWTVQLDNDPRYPLVTDRQVSS